MIEDLHRESLGFNAGVRRAARRFVQKILSEDLQGAVARVLVLTPGEPRAGPATSAAWGLSGLVPFDPSRDLVFAGEGGAAQLQFAAFDGSGCPLVRSAFPIEPRHVDPA